MVTWLEEQYPRGRDALVYTSRGVVTGQTAEESLHVSQTVSAAMVDVAQRLKTPPRYVIAKGGITSNDLALKAFGVHQATVPGQVAPGIPCWVLGDESRFPGVPYVIFPGQRRDAEDAGRRHHDAARGLSMPHDDRTGRTPPHPVSRAREERG